MKTLFIISFLLFCLSTSGNEGTLIINKSNAPADSIYIPINLEDCFKQLDTLFPDSIKAKIRALTEDEFSARYHLGFGMWMRNNWGLWKGSRLSKYFNYLGVYHPEDMTGIIFTSYHRKLSGSEINLNEQIKEYHDYWEKVKKENLEEKKNEIAKFCIGDTVFYSYKHGFASKGQEKKYDNYECNAKGIVIEKEETNFSIKVRLIDGCDKRGIISFDNMDIFVLNNFTQKLEKPKKRVVTYLKPGQEFWFNCLDWETEN